mmetsp:Transcript_4656/g.13460  ORF Transcript_4656/g.13460 Transcript_4656/m.13460 type:complete len:240 (+) Transcript_4656:949-1668(+)
MRMSTRMAIMQTSRAAAMVQQRTIRSQWQVKTLAAMMMLVGRLPMDHLLIGTTRRHYKMAILKRIKQLRHPHQHRPKLHQQPLQQIMTAATAMMTTTMMPTKTDLRTTLMTQSSCFPRICQTEIAKSPEDVQSAYAPTNRATSSPLLKSNNASTRFTRIASFRGWPRRMNRSAHAADRISAKFRPPAKRRCTTSTHRCETATLPPTFQLTLEFCRCIPALNIMVAQYLLSPATDLRCQS